MFRGSMVALVTPMTSDGSLDWAALHKLVDWHLAEGTHAIVAMGTTGESATLDTDEHLAVIRRTIDIVAGQIPVIAGTGSNSTAETIHTPAEVLSGIQRIAASVVATDVVGSKPRASRAGRSSGADELEGVDCF